MIYRSIDCKTNALFLRVFLKKTILNYVNFLFLLIISFKKK